MPRFPSKPVTGTDLETGQVTHYPSMYAATKAIAARRGKRAASMLPGLSHVLDKPDRSAHGCRWATTVHRPAEDVI